MLPKKVARHYHNVEELKNEIEKIIGIDKSYRAIIIGIGNIGQAILNYRGFQASGFNIVGLFDHADELVGSTINGLKVKDISELSSFMKEEKADIAAELEELYEKWEELAE